MKLKKDLRHLKLFLHLPIPKKLRGRIHAKIGVIYSSVKLWCEALEHLKTAIHLFGEEGNPLLVERISYAQERSGDYRSGQKTGTPIVRNQRNKSSHQPSRSSDWLRKAIAAEARSPFKDGEHHEAQQLTDAYLKLINFPGPDSEHLRNGMSSVWRFLLRKSIPPAPEEVLNFAGRDVPDSVSPLMISGFTYSGSGAIVDFLRNYKEINLSHSLREPGWLNGGYGSYHLLTADENFSVERAADFAVWNFLGIQPFQTRRNPKKPVIEVAVGPKVHETMNILMLNFFREISSAGYSPSRDQLESVLAALYKEILGPKLRTANGKYLLINNGIRPWQFRSAFQVKSL